PVYTVSALPAGTIGDIALASDGCANGQGTGAGTGVLCFYDGTAWRACDTGQTVTVSVTTATAAPNAPTALAGGTATANTMPLTWTASAVDGSHSAAASYTVQYCINGSTNLVTAASGITSASYTVAGLISGQTYEFSIFATNTAGNSGAATATAA